MNVTYPNAVFSTNLKRKIFDKKLSQRQISEKLSVNEVQISRWVTGKIIPSWTHVVGLCNLLEIGIEDLFNESAIKEAQSAPILSVSEMDLFTRFKLFEANYSKAS